MGESGKSTIWQQSELDILESTSGPGISVTALEEAAMPTLTVAAIVGVTVVVLIIIAVVFVLGVLIDCRQQRLLEEKMSAVKRLKNKRRVNSHPIDSLSIANNMEESGTSLPPAEVLRHNP